jgi:hypothetical protein
LTDFPWLWAINNRPSGCDAKFIKVNQDMSDLKLALSNPSSATKFVVWTVSVKQFDVFAQVRPLERVEGELWADAAMNQTEMMTDILYIAIADPIWGEDHPTRRITIFRHPEKQRLNEVVEHLRELCGSSASI